MDHFFQSVQKARLQDKDFSLRRLFSRVISQHAKNQAICLEYLILTASVAQHEMDLFESEEYEEVQGKQIQDLVKNLKQMKTFHSVNQTHSPLGEQAVHGNIFKVHRIFTNRDIG